MVVGCLLVASNPEKLMEREVLNKWQDRYDRATSLKEREYLEERSEKRGKRGWKLGREIVLPGKRHGCGDGEGTGRELVRAHLRRGHFHTVLHGKGKTLMKVMWYRPTIVRPELGDLGERGYRTAKDVG